MRDKLEKIIIAFEELEKKLSDPAVASDIKEFTRLNKEYAHQTDLVKAAREYLGALDDIDVAKEMLHDAADADEKEMLQMEISENEAKLPQLEEDIKIMLIPGDPMDEKDTIVEIRSAAGGDEAAILPHQIVFALGGGIVGVELGQHPGKIVGSGMHAEHHIDKIADFAQLIRLAAGVGDCHRSLPYKLFLGTSYVIIFFFRFQCVFKCFFRLGNMCKNQQ